MMSGLFFLMFTFNSVASIIQINNSGNMYQGPYSLIDFENNDDFFVNADGHLESVLGVTFHTSDGETDFYSSGLAGGVTPSGSRGLTPRFLEFPKPIIMEFAKPTSSVGMFFGNDDSCCTSGFNASLDIWGISGYIDTITVAANMNDYADQFIGFVSDELVTSVVIRYPTLQDEIGLITYIDDVQFNVVPETSILLLMATGIVGIVFVHRKRIQY
jgi:hypothetical protein